MEAKPDAEPVATQPIRVFHDDRSRARYLKWDNSKLGTRERPTRSIKCKWGWISPGVIDQVARRVLGRMLTARGKVNYHVAREGVPLGGSWRRAAWCKYRTVPDATRGYTQLVLDDRTRAQLRCGDARWGVRVVEHALRTFPRASGRAELCMQKFGGLRRTRTGMQFSSPVMDDIVAKQPSQRQSR